MSKLQLSELIPEVEKIMKRAEDFGLEYEVIAQMIVNAYEVKPSGVIQRMWDALADWDIPSKDEEDEFNKHLNTNMEG